MLPWLNCLNPRDVRLFQYMQISEYNLVHRQGQKLYDHLNNNLKMYCAS